MANNQLTRRQALQTLGGLGTIALTGCANMNALDVGGAVLGGPVGNLMGTAGSRKYIDERLGQLTNPHNAYHMAARSRYDSSHIPLSSLIFTCNEINEKYKHATSITKAGDRQSFDESCFGVKNIFDDDEEIIIGWQIKRYIKVKDNEEFNIKCYQEGEFDKKVYLNNYRGKVLFDKVWSRHGVLKVSDKTIGNKRVDLCAENRVLASTTFQIIDKDAPQQARKETTSERIRGLKDLGDLKRNGDITEQEYQNMKRDLMK